MVVGEEGIELWKEGAGGEVWDAGRPCALVVFTGSVAGVFGVGLGAIAGGVVNVTSVGVVSV